MSLFSRISQRQPVRNNVSPSTVAAAKVPRAGFSVRQPSRGERNRSCCGLATRPNWASTAETSQLHSVPRSNSVKQSPNLTLLLRSSILSCQSCCATASRKLNLGNAGRVVLRPLAVRTDEPQAAVARRFEQALIAGRDFTKVGKQIAAFGRHSQQR